MAGSWLELSVVAEPEAADAVAEVFGRWGRGVAIDQPVRQAPDGDGGWVDATQNVVVKTYLPVDEQAEEHRRLLEEAAWHLGRLRHVEPLQTRVLAEEDWAHAWKKFFHPHRVGKRLVIVPSWRRRARQPEDVVIRLDPGMAFGTGLHPTTRLCLALIEEHLRMGDAVLDFGCGSAILSIAAARLGAARILAIDVDPVAVRVAEENARRNRVLRKVRVAQGTVEPDMPVPGAPFGLIAANISAFVLKNARDGLHAAIEPGRVAILSGILATAADDVLATYAAGGWQHVETRQEGDWVAIVVRRG
ncbi:MAG: 50S ribosomal protein L11 methyltransferase [Chloroflexota bacterium]|nr:50S ribosomal protein L11 methyltransferase [Chloroflexota bacterium]